jgi:phosphatidate cytidylyltransferase
VADIGPVSGRLASAEGNDPGRSELAKRVLSALVLAPLALGAVYVGGWPFVLFWGVAALGVYWEWTTIVADANKRGLLATGLATLVLACILTGYGRLGMALAIVAAAALVAGMIATRGQRLWACGGVLYAGIVVLAPAALRADPEYGLFAIVLLFAVVWASDILGYFVGRAVGGPKLAPRVSPKKTWSGTLGGIIGAVGATFAIAAYAGVSNTIALGMLAVVLSVASQAGDLGESAIKRKFGVKDASRIIPGHGGLMDRLDGFLAAAAAAAIIGIARGGLGSSARGLLMW